MAGKSKKREERQIRAAHRRHKRQQYNGKDTSETQGDFVSLRTQLEVIGLTLREVPGDGNCLFRALSDQLTGVSDSHIQLRKDTVEYMQSNRGDFEPFLDESVTFERHLKLLGDDGTYAGNDSIVAFARGKNLTVVIHQLNEPLWYIYGDESDQSAKELHLSYHNGDHYNSVRRIGEPKHQRSPANIKISLLKKETLQAKKAEEEKRKFASDYDESKYADWENLNDFTDGQEEIEQTEDENVIRVMELGGVDDPTLARDALEVNANCVEAAVEYLQQLNVLSPPACDVNESLKGARRKAKTEADDNGRDRHIWAEGGTASRILGESVANSIRANDKKSEIQRRLDSEKLSNKRRKELKRALNKLEKDQRTKNSNEAENDDENEPIVAQINALSI